MVSPLLSLIIPSYNKATELAISLPLLDNQTVGPENWQLIIVDDGSTDRTAEVVKSHARKRDLTLISLDPAGRRVSRARNIGAEYANGRYLLFLDPDILASPQLIAAHVDLLRERQTVVSLGYMYGVGIGSDEFRKAFGAGGEWNFSEIDTVLGRAAEYPDLSDTRWNWATSPNEFEDLPCPWAGGWTGNMALSRTAFINAGGFDETFLDRGMEDIDISYRLHLDGVKFELNGDAIGFHFPHPKDHDRVGNADATNGITLLKKFPEIEIELSKVFSCSQVNTVLPFFRRISAENPSVDPLDLEPIFSALDVRDAKVCLAGSYPDSVLGFSEERCLTLEKLTGLRPSVNGDINRVMPLVGLATPYDSKSFDLAILVDSWVNLPLAIAATLIEELCRISFTLVVCSTGRNDLSNRLGECELEFLFKPLTCVANVRTFTVQTRNAPRDQQEIFLNEIPLSVIDRGTARVWNVAS